MHVLQNNNQKQKETKMTSRCKLVTAAGVAALVAASAVNARAAATLTIDDGPGGLDAITISDNGAGDLSPLTGQIHRADFGYAGWTVTFNTGATKDFFGTATQPMMNLDYNVRSGSAGGTLVITFTDDGFGPVPGPLGDGASTVLATIDGTTGGGSVSYKTFVNSVAATTDSPTLGGNSYKDTQYGFATGLNMNPWTMSQEITIVHDGEGLTSGDALLVVPEPSTYLAGGMLLIPFAASTIRFIRKKRTA